MSATSEPRSRPAKVSRKLLESLSKGAHQSSDAALSASASVATSTLNQTPTLAPAGSSGVADETPERAEPLPTIVDAERWKPFHDIQLLPKPATQAAQKLIVSTYRVLGLAILTLIVVVLLGYIAVSTFYFFSRSWVTPVAISANDARVVALQSQLAAQLNERARLIGELEQAESAIAAEQSFELQFVKAIRKDLQGRKIALGRARQLSHAALTTREEIRTTNGDYSRSSAERMSDDFAAGMIDRDAMLAGKFQLAQISAANLTLAERQADFDQRAAELAVQAESLDAILANKSATAALSYDVLMIAREYERSKLALARELGNRERLKASIERQDQIIDGLKQSAYLRAATNGATMALVPYANLGDVKKGTPLYGCKLEMLICHQVGHVLDVLPGEVEVKHPSRDSIMRGRMIEMQMSEPDAAEEMVLFAGDPPLGL